MGLVQTDIKRVIAYSTCSQLGYMFVAAGVGMYSAAMFHLFTHAFFKALLFLGAGSVIHAMHHEQDMTELWRVAEENPVYVLGDDDRHVGHHGCRHSAYHDRLCRVPVQRRDYRKRVCWRHWLCLLDAGNRGDVHLVLQLASDLPDLLRQRAWATSTPMTTRMKAR